ncbi:MAG: hypothetical protein ACRDI2_09105, partial [Chloroflexota bacterium]
TPAPAPVTPAPPTTPAVADAAGEARAAYQRALDALRAGDFATFGEELRNLDERLSDLERLSQP